VAEQEDYATTNTLTPISASGKDKNTNNALPLGKFPFGKTLKNRDDIFRKVDNALGVDKPPDVEVILTDHLVDESSSVSKFLHLNLLRFGHIAIRYTTSDGEQHVQNIMGDFRDPDSTLINFFKPEDYFFGTDPKIAQQGGIYNRPFVGVRIENTAPGATDAMHSYFQAVSKASEIGSEEPGDHTATGTTPHKVVGAPGSAKRGAARFQLVEVQFSKLARTLPAPLDRYMYNLADWIRERDDDRREAMLKASQSVQTFAKEQDQKYLDGQATEMMDDMDRQMKSVRNSLYQSGNCAQWTSQGLEFAGLIRRARLFPKAILIDLLEDEYLSNGNEDNVHVVYYDQVPGCPEIYPNHRFIKSAMVSPLKWVRNSYYDNMKDFAHAIVETPRREDGDDDDNFEATVIRRTEPPKVPKKWLQYWSMTTIYLPSAVALGLVDHVGPIGPAVAIVWLAANLWLY